MPLHAKFTRHVWDFVFGRHEKDNGRANRVSGWRTPRASRIHT
jgi:hypothetical protein